jgi:hypothetical protein
MMADPNFKFIVVIAGYFVVGRGVTGKKGLREKALASAFPAVVRTTMGSRN